MDKARVRAILPFAVSIVKDKKDKEIDKKTRNLMSSYGATIVMSGLLPAIAGFSKGKSQKSDSKQIANDLMLALADKTSASPDLKDDGQKVKDFYNKALEGEYDEKAEIVATEIVLDYIISIKLALDMLIGE